MSKVIILKKDITKCETECIVNSANEHLKFGSGVCGAIFRSAGVLQLTKACDNIGYCNTGNAEITPAFELTNYK